MKKRTARRLLTSLTITLLLAVLVVAVNWGWVSHYRASVLDHEGSELQLLFAKCGHPAASGTFDDRTGRHYKTFTYDADFLVLGSQDLELIVNSDAVVVACVEEELPPPWQFEFADIEGWKIQGAWLELRAHLVSTLSEFWQSYLC